MIKDLHLIQEDLSIQTESFLRGIVMLSLAIGIIIFGYLLVDSYQTEIAVPWLLIVLGSGSSAFLIRRNRHRPAMWTYLFSLIGYMVADIYAYGLDSKAFFMLPLPVILSSVVLDDEWLPYVAGLTITPVAIITGFAGGLTGIWNYVLTPSIVAVLSTIMLMLYSHSKLGFVEWAIDSQRKNESRADIFYQQREQLKEAMLEVQKAYSKLEKANNQLAEARLKAEEASKAKSTFLSNMSHELRTPLNTVIGYSSSMLNMPSMYKNEPLAEVYQNDLRVILANGQYLLGLINDILDLSKIEAGKLHIHPEEIDLSMTVQGVIATSVGLTQGKPLQIRPDVADDLPRVWGDETRIRQILLNLMSNAIKFTDSGRVTLSARLVDERVQLSVTDTGIGIPEGALQRIFDRFEQAQYDTDRHYGGTGLGLDISQRLCEMHGSRLVATSVVGQGSTFSFTLPLATSASLISEDTHDSDTLLPDITEPSIMLDVPIILLIENDAPTRNLLRRVLEPYDYVVMEASGGEHGLESAEGLLPDLVILDLQLPDISGIEVLEAMRMNELLASIPVIILSVADENEKTRTLAQHYFKKPVRPDTLLAQIKHLLQQPLQQENPQ